MLKTSWKPRTHSRADALKAELKAVSGDRPIVEYERLHRVLAEGSYGLFRIAEGKLVEHWDTIEAVPARSEWKNDNGKF